MNTRTVLTGATLMAIVVAGCTGSGATEPTLPPGTPTTTSTPTPTTTPSTPTATPTPTVPPTPTTDQLADLVNNYRNILLQVPAAPIPELRTQITDQAEATTTPDGTARQVLDNFTAQLTPEVPIIRGTSHAAILNNPQPDLPDWTATGCVATEGQHTMPETGEPAETDPFVGKYTEVELRIAPDNTGDWLLADYTTPDDPRDRTDCVPPDMADSIEQRWNELRSALSQWTQDGQPATGLEAIGELVTEASLQTLTEVAGERTISGDPAIDIAFGFEISRASPSEADTRWCLDYSRDPSARATDNATGQVTDLSQQRPVVISTTWTRSDGKWVQGPTEADVPGEEGRGPCS